MEELSLKIGIMKKVENRVCCVCGKICGPKHHEFRNGMCPKHYEQTRRFGRTLDTNPRSVYDDNEIRILDGYAEIDTYNGKGEVLETFKLDIEDVPLLKGHKWRTVYKGKHKSPYLLTGHGGTQGSGQIYFHRLVMGMPDCEIDHININSRDNRKENLRMSYRTQQAANTRLRVDNTQGIKGVYFIQRDNGYRAEIQCGKTHVYSPKYHTKAEAAYMRLLLEQFFYKDIGINNSSELRELAETITPEQKMKIDTYFMIKSRNWIC